MTGDEKNGLVAKIGVRRARRQRFTDDALVAVITVTRGEPRNLGMFQRQLVCVDKPGGGQAVPDLKQPPTMIGQSLRTIKAEKSPVEKRVFLQWL